MGYTPEQVSRATRAVIWIVVASIALILGIYMFAQLAVGSHSKQAIKNTNLMSEQAVAERMKPVGEVAVDPNAPAPTATAPAAAPAAGAAAVTALAPADAAAPADKGKATYDAVCTTCHNMGVAGAPKTGDKGQWEARIAQGKDTLYASALKGKGVMPAKGGRTDISDDDVKAAVDYLVAQVK